MAGASGEDVLNPVEVDRRQGLDLVTTQHLPMEDKVVLVMLLDPIPAMIAIVLVCAHLFSL